MPGKAPRQKGNRLERQIVNWLKESELDAFRVPYSGSMANFKGDVQIKTKHHRFTAEAKSRSGGFKFLYDNLGINNFLIIRKDREKPLVIMDFNQFLELMKTVDKLDDISINSP
jgi:Holliday junction resolvase